MANLGFGNAGDADKPSGIIWANCPLEVLNQEGKGFFFHEDFMAVPTGVLAAALDVTMVTFGNSLKLAADVATVLTQKAAELGGYLDIETDGDDNDAAAIVSQPFCRIVKDSGKKVWFEARVELGDVAMDGGFFVGLVEEAGATVEIIADDAAATVGESNIGFRVLTDDPNAIDAVYKKDAGTEVEAKADVAAIVADTEIKLGLYFDGRDKLQWFVDGVKVAEQVVNATVDQSKDMTMIIGIKTGAAAAESFAVDWVRYAYQRVG